jgi:hypothetical protein
VKVLQGEHDASPIKLYVFPTKSTGLTVADEVEEVATRAVLEGEAAHFVCVIHLGNEVMIDSCQYGPFILINPEIKLGLLEDHLEGEELAFLTRQNDLAERALAYHLDQLEILHSHVVCAVDFC